MAGPLTFAIPYYSGEEYLRRAIGSLHAQDDASWDAVVCDDSAAGVEALVHEAGRGRVRYARNPKNLGLGGNFNRCLDVPDTDLVTILHADDELAPSYTRTMRAAADRSPRAAALFCRADIIGPESRPAFSLVDAVKGFINPAQHRETVLAGEPGIRALLRANFIMAPTLCFRTSVLGDRRFDASYRFVLDWDLTTRLLLDGDELVGLPDCCYRYRRHDANATEQLTRTHLRFREESAFYDRMQGIARARGWDACARLARDKRMVKLNLAYRTLKSAARMQLGDARRGLELLRELSQGATQDSIG